MFSQTQVTTSTRRQLPAGFTFSSTQTPWHVSLLHSCSLSAEEKACKKQALAVAFIEKRQFCCFRGLREPEKLLRITPSHQSKDWEEKLKGQWGVHDNKTLKAIENLSRTAAQILQVGFSKGINSTQRRFKISHLVVSHFFHLSQPPTTCSSAISQQLWQWKDRPSPSKFKKAQQKTPEKNQFSIQVVSILS